MATQNATNLINALTLLSPGSDLEKDTELQGTNNDIKEYEAQIESLKATINALRTKNKDNITTANQSITSLKTSAADAITSYNDDFERLLALANSNP